MSSLYKEYKMTLKTVGPVFVGDGRQIDKKSYIFTDEKHIQIIDLEKMYSFLKNRACSEDYEEFLMNQPEKKLKEWLEEKKIKKSEIENCVKYNIDCGDAIQIDSNDIKICEHIKDPYGKPYIPGSSIKGMLRTILLADDIINNKSKYNIEKNSIQKNSIQQNANKYKKGKYYLKDETSDIEKKCFYTLNKNTKNKSNAVNDILSGIVVSDSEPLDINDLVLCKKIEGHTNGSEHSINILRECIKPETNINFTITIDEKKCKQHITIEKIFSAVKNFVNCYNECFIEMFQDAEPLQNDYVIIGGGSGFVSKTIMYPLFDRKEGVALVREIFFKTIAEEKSGNHKNKVDLQEGISPHIIKYTRYNGKIYQMGVCELIMNE